MPQKGEGAWPECLSRSAWSAACRAPSLIHEDKRSPAFALRVRNGRQCCFHELDAADLGGLQFFSKRQQIVHAFIAQWG